MVPPSAHTSAVSWSHLSPSDCALQCPDFLRAVLAWLQQLWRAQGASGRWPEVMISPCWWWEIQGNELELHAFQMAQHRWDQSLGIQNVHLVSSSSQDCQSTLGGAGNAQHQPPKMENMCHEVSFPLTRGTLLLAVSLDLGREYIFCCCSSQQKRLAVLQKLSEREFDPLRPEEKGGLAGVREQSF